MDKKIRKGLFAGIATLAFPAAVNAQDISGTIEANNSLSAVQLICGPSQPKSDLAGAFCDAHEGVKANLWTRLDGCYESAANPQECAQGALDAYSQDSYDLYVKTFGHDHFSLRLING